MNVQVFFVRIVLDFVSENKIEIFFHYFPYPEQYVINCTILYLFL